MTADREIELCRVYDPARRDDEDHRVLVDRLWPRGFSKAEAALDEWLKDVAPSTELRRWYGHDVERFEEFARRYRAELLEPPASAGVDHLTERGVVSVESLYGSPYTDKSPQGPDGLFPTAEVDKLVKILHEVRDRAVA